MEVSDSDSSSDDFEKPKQKNKPVESLGGEKSNSDSITAKVKKLYKCQHCSSTFKKKSNCSRHASICSSNKEKASHGFICDICKACYNRKDNLSAHRKTCGASKPSCSSTKVTRKRKPCLIKGCDLEFVHYISLIEHLRSCHQGDVTMKPMVSRTFLSIKEFNVWKEKEEVDTFSYFTKRRGERESAVQHFYCQHDGSAKLHSNRLTSRCNLKNRVKVGHHCIAKMIARVDPETKGVHLEYHPTHTHLCKSEDLLHHPLPDDMSRFINQKLAEHIPPTVVYELTKARFLPKTDVTSINPRANILTKKRILERGRRIRMARRLHKDDARAVFLMVNQFIECDNSILLYKPYGSSVQHGPKEIDHLPDSRQLFMLGIQTQRQLEIFKKFCSKIVILDETHGTNQYKYQLLTAMVVDENRRGWPIAHLITSKSDGPTLQYFFKTLKARLGNEAKIGCVITDDDSALIGGMNAGFSEQLKHILCIWHVFKNLKENVRTKASKSLFDNILSEVKLLMNVKEENMFKKLSNGFVKKYKNSEEAVEFVNYFNKYYLNRCEKWAMCYRNFPHAEVNTTGHIESFHSRLKKFYLKRKVNKRLDDLIHILLDVEWDDHCTRLRESTIGFSTLPQQILQRHQRGLLMDDDSIVENCLENTWEVKSATGKSLSYVIVRHKEMCSSDHCFSKCTKLECHGLCAHLFSCSCADRHPICKHIHKLQSFLTRGQPNVGVQEADFYTLQSTKNNSDFTIEDENHECQHNEEAIPEENNGRKWDSMILRLKDNFSCLEKFIIAAEQKKVPEHTVIHADALLTDLVRGLGPLDLPCNENPVTDIPQMTPAIKFTPNETLKTQLSQLSSFKRPQKRKAKSDLFSLSEKKKNAMESLLMCAEDGNRNSDNDIPDSQVSVDEYDSFTLSYTYVPDPFDNVLTCGEEKISLLHLKALELELPHEEKEMILERDPSFTCGLVPPCIINVFALQLCEQFEHVSYLSSHFARSAARGDSNVELLREHLSKQIIIVSANFSDNHWFVLAIMLEEQAIRLYDPMYKPLSSEIIHCLSQIVSDLKVLYPLIPMWKIKVVNLHEQKVDEIYSGEKICNFIEETVCGKPNIAMVPPCFNFRKHLYSVIVGNCMKRMSFSEEACGKCGRPYNEISHDQDIWTSCLRCQQWFHEACLQRNNSGYFICP